MMRAWLLGTLLTGALSGTAWASLDGNLASVQADAQVFSAVSNQTAINGATVHVQTLPNALTLRQYVDSSGLVFAVGWDGPVLPDFERLLGQHYAAYANAVPKQRRSVNLHDSAVVIESGGMMRAYAGRAYLPGRLPIGWSVNDIR